MLPVVLLVVAIAADAVAQGWFVLDVLPPNPISIYVDRLEDAGRMRERMRQVGLDAVTRMCRMEHACNPPYMQMERDWSYFYGVAYVEKIPDASWSLEAVRQKWQRGSAQNPLQREALRTAMGFNDAQAMGAGNDRACAWLPTPADMESPRFMLSFLRIASSDGAPMESAWHDVTEVSMLAYDTQTSKLYYFYASL